MRPRSYLRLFAFVGLLDIWSCSWVRGKGAGELHSLCSLAWQRKIEVVSGTPMAAHMHPMTLLDHGIHGCPSAHWPSRSVWFLCENDGCDGTERPADDQEADTLPRCKRALSESGGSEAYGVIR